MQCGVLHDQATLDELVPAPQPRWEQCVSVSVHDQRGHINTGNIPTEIFVPGWTHARLAVAEALAATFQLA